MHISLHFFVLAFNAILLCSKTHNVKHLQSLCTEFVARLFKHTNSTRIQRVVHNTHASCRIVRGGTKELLHILFKLALGVIVAWGGQPRR